MNLPPGCTEADIDRVLPDEPEYELTEADLEDAYLDRIDQQAAGSPDPVFYECVDWILVNAAIEEKRMERWAA